jgi:hypothetical protein
MTPNRPVIESIVAALAQELGCKGLSPFETV